MLPPGSGIYIRRPDDTARRFLVPATLKERNDGVYSIEVEKSDFDLRPGLSMLLYYEVDRVFMQQSAKVVALLESDPKPVIGVELIGDPISAEGRECYRVQTASENLVSTFGGEPDCPVQDISATGFSVYCTGTYQVGQQITASLKYKKKEYQGTVCIQSIRKLDCGRMRYGVRALGSRQGGGDLEKGLRDLAMVMQRLQLRRLAGTG